MGRDKNNNRMVLDTKFGQLVCEVVRDDDEFKEFAIDLYRNDGKATQICVVGTNEGEFEPTLFSDNESRNYFDMVHTFLYDGENPDDCERHYTNPYGEGWWGEETFEDTPAGKQCCPKCDEVSDVEGGHVQIDGNVAWQNVTCNKCGFEYTEVYEYKFTEFEEEEE